MLSSSHAFPSFGWLGDFPGDAVSWSGFEVYRRAVSPAEITYMYERAVAGSEPA